MLKSQFAVVLEIIFAWDSFERYCWLYALRLDPPNPNDGELFLVDTACFDMDD